MRLLWRTWHRLGRMATPMVVASASTVMVGIVDTAIVGHLGPEALAAVAAASALYMIAAEVTYASAVGFRIEAAQAVGRSGGRPPGLSGPFASALPLTMGTALAAAAVLVWAQPVDAVVPDLALAGPAAAYLAYRSVGLPLAGLSVLLRMALEVRGAPVWGMHAALITNVVNAAATYLLVYGELGLPAMGVAGAGLGALLGQTAGCAVLVGVVLYRKVLAGRDSEASLRGRAVAQLARLSGPEMLSVGVDHLGTLVFVMLAASLGTLELAATRVAFTVLLAVFIVMSNAGFALQIMLGHKLGENAVLSGRAEWRSGSALVLALAGVSGLAMAAVAEPLAAVFTPAPELRAEAAAALRIVALTVPALACSVVVSAALRAMRATRAVMLSNIGCIWLVQVPVAWGLGVQLGYGVAGLFAGVFLYFVGRASLEAALLARRFDRQLATAGAAAAK